MYNYITRIQATLTKTHDQYTINKATNYDKMSKIDHTKKQLTAPNLPFFKNTTPHTQPLYVSTLTSLNSTPPWRSKLQKHIREPLDTTMGHGKFAAKTASWSQKARRDFESA
jgi:hypothetical protein